jgi:hypothetical protein
MNLQKAVLRFVLCVLALVLLAACGTEPVSLSDIPVYPGVKPMERGQNAFADQMADAIKESSGKEDVSAELKLYTLPAGAAWSDVKSYYVDNLADGDWQTEQDLAEESDIFSSLGWTRGGGASEQALVVGHLADITGEGAFLIVMLFSE